jgi:putative thioredoxin
MSNFGAMDLSGLTHKDQPVASKAVADWLVKGDEATLRAYLSLSETTPVLMLVTDQSEASARVRSAVYEVIQASAGRFAGIEISIEEQPQIAQAVAVAQAPAMLAILAGQPAPLFQGEATKEQLMTVLGQVLQMASEKGITSQVSANGTPVTPERPLSPEHQAALAAIDSGDLSEAKRLYEKLIIEYPNDSEAKAGLAQVKFMIRLSEGSSIAAGDELAKVFGQADQLLVSGDADSALGSLLDRFEVDLEARDQIRQRLLELFILIGDAEPSVLTARRRLATLMF